MGVVKTAAPIAANIVLPGSGALVQGLMDSAIKAVDPGVAVEEMSAEEKAAVIAQNPEMLTALKTKAMELEEAIAKEKTKNMDQVNVTAREELRHGNWWQKGWRPFNGYMFPIAVLACYVVIPIWAWHVNALVTIDVPASLWVIWAGILGVAVYGRNQEKKAAGPEAQASGIMKVIRALRK